MKIPMVRMRRHQKRAFRQRLLMDFPEAKLDKHLGATNIIIGDLEQARVVVGAHYDTPPQMPSWFMNHIILWGMVIIPLLFFTWFEVMFRIPMWTSNPWIYANLELYFGGVMVIGYGVMLMYVLHMFGITPFANPANYNDNTSGIVAALDVYHYAKLSGIKTCVILFDNEEKGLFGSISFRIRYNKLLRDKRIIVLDCVANGDIIKLYHTGIRIPNVVSLIEKAQNASCVKHNDPKLKIKRTHPLSVSDHVSFIGLNSCLLIGSSSTKSENPLKYIHTKGDKYNDKIPSVLSHVKYLIAATITNPTGVDFEEMVDRYHGSY